MGNLIVFGAGASFGSDDGDWSTPPLGEGLFDALCQFDRRGWRAVPQQFADLFRADFEQGMRAFADAHPSDGLVDQLHCDMGAYFHRFEPRPSSLYVRLAERIRASNWEGALPTLNYERLLELALRRAGLESRIQGVRSGASEVELVLPHGCCNLFCMIRAERPRQGAGCSGAPAHGAGTFQGTNLATQGPSIIKPPKGPDGREILTTLRAQNGGLISLGPHLRVDSDEYRVLDDPGEHAKELRESTIPPVMCYYQPDKDTRAGVSFIKSQRGRYAKLVGEAEVVGVVGVRVRLHDAHIWEALRKTRARIVYCAGRSGAEEFKTWTKASVRRGDQVLPDYWAEGFDDVCSAVGIKPSE